MKKNKVLMIVVIALLSISLVSGCGILEKFGMGENKKQQEDTEVPTESLTGTEEMSESTETEEDWVPNLDLTQNSTEQTDKEEEKCNCVNACTSTEISTTCSVCKEDFHKCKGESPEDPLDAFALPEGQTGTVTMAAFGSNFYDTAIMNGTDKSYNYDYIYKNIQEMLKNYDVKIVTQETIFANDPSKYSGKSPFKSPPSIASALVNAGFNVISCATDHAFDNGATGVIETLNAWKQYNNSVFVTGICASEEDYNNICIADVNGIRIAFLSYTSSLNGMTLTNDEKTYVKTLYDENSVADEIKYASKNADFVIVLPHWGSEESKTHTSNQEKWAKVFIDNGADLILGTGSRFIQDVSLYEGENGQYVPCYYSLGNFVGKVDNELQALSGAAEITITKTGKVTNLESYNMIPVVLHVSKKGDYFQSYILSEYPEDTIKYHNLLTRKKNISLESLNKIFSETVEIKDIKSYSPSGESSVMSPVQTRKPDSGEVDTEQENNGNPLVNEEDTEEQNTEDSGGLSNLTVIGG